MEQEPPQKGTDSIGLSGSLQGDRDDDCAKRSRLVRCHAWSLECRLGVRSAADRADGRHPYDRVRVHRSAVVVFVSKMKGGYLTALFTAIMSTVILLATLLHAVESAIWAASY
jgi:hypothetical protein